MLQMTFARLFWSAKNTFSQGIWSTRDQGCVIALMFKPLKLWGDEAVLYIFFKKWIGFFSHAHVAGEGRLLLFFLVLNKHQESTRFGQHHMVRLGVSGWISRVETDEKKRPPTWRIIPVSKWLVTPSYKPFSPFGRGITSASARINHGY